MGVLGRSLNRVKKGGARDHGGKPVSRSNVVKKVFKECVSSKEKKKSRREGLRRKHANKKASLETEQLLRVCCEGKP